MLTPPIQGPPALWESRMLDSMDRRALLWLVRFLLSYILRSRDVSTTTACHWIESAKAAGDDLKAIDRNSRLLYLLGASAALGSIFGRKGMNL
jgi:hypothetical protein